MRCFLIGHREAPPNLLPVLHETTERHIREYGVTEFLVGNYGNFDRLALGMLKSLKEQYPHIRVLLLLPYYTATRSANLPEGVDESWFPAQVIGVPKRAAILAANRAAVAWANYLIAYVTHPSNGARVILGYARQQEKRGLLRVENLGDLPEDDDTLEGVARFV